MRPSAPTGGTHGNHRRALGPKAARELAEETA
jgi:hypothetical protein